MKRPDRYQGFEFAHDIQPVEQGRSTGFPPVLDGEGELGRPEQQRANRREELIAASVQQIDPKAQSSRLLGGRNTVSGKRRAQPEQQRGFEALGLDPSQEFCEKGQVACRKIRGTHHLQHPLPQPGRQDHLRGERSDEGGGAEDARKPAAQRHHRSGGHRTDTPAPRSARQELRSLAPPLQGLGMETGFDLGAEQRQVFSQFDPSPQLGDRRLTLANLVRGCGFEQPTGQRILARLGTRLAQKFEDRAHAKEIEIARMYVFAVSIALARLTGPGPGPLHSRQSSFMEDDAPIRPLPSTNHPIVHEQKRDETPGR